VTLERSRPANESRLSLRVSLPAEPDSVPQLRHRAVEFARAAGLTAAQLDALRLAVTEAAANVVIHAYDDNRGLVHLEAAKAGDELWVIIADDGCGLRSDRESPGLGQGLRLISRNVDSFTVVERSGGGTEVRMRFKPPQARGSVASATSPA
jgi:anti-sigma regulatory factor (Ser/Thr protein kinase)